VISALTCLKFYYYVTTPVSLILQRIQFNIQGLSILKFAIISLETMSIMVIVKFSLIFLVEKERTSSYNGSRERENLIFLESNFNRICKEDKKNE